MAMTDPTDLDLTYLCDSTFAVTATREGWVGGGGGGECTCRYYGDTSCVAVSLETGPLGRGVAQ